MRVCTVIQWSAGAKVKMGKNLWTLLIHGLKTDEKTRNWML